jgi:hypothetical protein
MLSFLQQLREAGLVRHDPAILSLGRSADDTHGGHKAIDHNAVIAALWFVILMQSTY